MLLAESSGMRTRLCTYAHSNAIKSANTKELRQVLSEARSQLERNESQEIGNHDVLPAVPVADGSRKHGADRAQHEGDRDTPSDRNELYVELFGNLRRRQRYGEEVEG